MYIMDNTNNGNVEISTRKKKKSDYLEHFGEEYVQPGDNARYLRYARVGMDLPPIHIDRPEEVENRIQEYFDFCEKTDRKPNIVGMANWLGIDRTTLASWKRGEYRRDTHSHMVQKAVNVLEELFIDYMMNGKVNPGSGAFVAKNLFGWRDVVELSTPQQEPVDVPTADDIAAKYAELPEYSSSGE